jgi:hypothetical protein
LDRFVENEKNEDPNKQITDTHDAVSDIDIISQKPEFSFSIPQNMHSVIKIQSS